MKTPTLIRLCVLNWAFAIATAGHAAENNVKFDNDQARILFVTSPTDAKSSLHEHKVNRVMIYLDGGEITLTDQNGKVQALKFKAGDALWSPASGPHISRNVSGHPVRIVEVEIKSKPGEGASPKLPELDPTKVDPKRYKLVLENEQVRVMRVRYGAHEKGVLHEHVLNRAVTFLTDGQMKITTPDGESKIQKSAAGDIIWGGQAKHTEENLGDQPFEVVVVEFKK